MKYLLLLLSIALCSPLCSQALMGEEGNYLYHGDFNKEGLQVGKWVWLTGNNEKIAEINFDEEGVLLSYSTWVDGEIYDAEKFDPERERKALAEEPGGKEEGDIDLYRLEREGDAPDGPRKDGEKVYVLYEGWIQDGTVFDSNFEGGKPFKFTLGKQEVIPGFEAAVKQMRIGETVLVYIPMGDMGYGPRAMGVIYPFAGLWYTIKLVKVK